jgi:dTDP-4-dehydrorhamnose 3,5-epimerase
MIATEPTIFDEARIFVPAVFSDERGYFKETYSSGRYALAGLDETFVQDNVSYSLRHVLRGMHYDFRMAKLVQALRGEVFDVIVDMREDSATYRQWQGFTLSADNHAQLYVPRGFAHGFLVLSDDALVMYKQTAPYDPAHELAISWRDSSVGVEWPISGEPLLSPKDAALPSGGQ